MRTLQISGPSKCGTTTMAFALNKHPMLVGLEDYENVKDESNNLKAPLMLSLLEHEDFFQKVPISEINGGKLPTVFYYKPNAISDPVVPMHMVEWHHFLHVSGFKFDTTQMRFVVMLREPVSRAYSSWSFRVQVGTEHRSWEQTVQQNLQALSAWTSCLAQHNITRHSVLESCHIQKFGSGASSIYDEHFMKSVYSIQLKYWLLFFHPSQFHIVFMEDFIQEPLEAFEGVLRFAGLELLDKNGQTGFPDRVTALRLVTTVSNPTKKTEKNSALLTEETQTMLSSFFEDFNEQLAEIVGLCFTPYHSHERRRSLWQGTWTTEVISSSIGAQSNVPWLFLDETTNSSRRCRG